jgi:hypothetical protein
LSAQKPGDFVELFARLASHLINTSLQRGESEAERPSNRFNGFPHGVETVETVPPSTPSKITLLKRGVKETDHRR